MSQVTANDEPRQPVAAGPPSGIPSPPASEVTRRKASSSRTITRAALRIEVGKDEAPGATTFEGRLSFIAPPMLTSIVLHAVLLIILGLLTIEPQRIDVTLHNLVVEAPFQDAPIENLGNEEPVQDFNLENGAVLEAVTAEPMPSSTALDVEQNFEPTMSAAVELSGLGEIHALSENLMASVGGALSGDLGQRGSEEARAMAVASGGGSPGSESAVSRALEWLAKHQNRDGSWSFDHRLSPDCKGHCNHPGALGNARFAATGFGLLPFLGAGNTHTKGKYKKNVDDGLHWLCKHMQGGSMYEPAGMMYGHGVAAIALTEAYAMTQDKYLHGYAQAAIDFTVSAQDPKGGGWRYHPLQAGDTSCVGWQVMALKSGHMGYLAVPPKAVAGATLFLNTVQADDGATYGYDQPGADQATTAIGLLCRMYLGWKKDNPALQKGVEQLSSWGPSTGPGQANMYYNYYATQVMHHWEGELWDQWNLKMRDFLVESQSQEGHMRGSWYLAGDPGSDVGGRLYITALCAMTLEVYYRHLPLYRKISTEDEFEE